MVASYWTISNFGSKFVAGLHLQACLDPEDFEFAQLPLNLGQRMNSHHKPEEEPRYHRSADGDRNWILIGHLLAGHLKLAFIPVSSLDLKVSLNIFINLKIVGIVFYHHLEMLVLSVPFVGRPPQIPAVFCHLQFSDLEIDLCFGCSPINLQNLSVPLHQILFVSAVDLKMAF